MDNNVSHFSVPEKNIYRAIAIAQCTIRRVLPVSTPQRPLQNANKLFIAFITNKSMTKNQPNDHNYIAA